MSVQKNIIGISILSIEAIAFAQTQIVVSAFAWNLLTKSEQESIQSKYIVQAIAADSFGVILDNQGIDLSTQSSDVGSNIGQAVGSSTYIDKAIAGGNYSARDHLGAMLLGTLIGSTFNSQKVENYHFRYAVRLANGNIGYHDIISGSPFRHPTGVCVLIPQVSVASNQNLCNQNAEYLRKTYLGDPSTDIPSKNDGSYFNENKLNNLISQEHVADKKIANDILVNCKLGSLPPVKTTQIKCQLINGAIEK